MITITFGWSDHVQFNCVFFHFICIYILLIEHVQTICARFVGPLICDTHFCTRLFWLCSWHKLPRWSAFCCLRFRNLCIYFWSQLWCWSFICLCDLVVGNDIHHKIYLIGLFVVSNIHHKICSFFIWFVCGKQHPPEDLFIWFVCGKQHRPQDWFIWFGCCRS